MLEMDRQWNDIIMNIHENGTWQKPEHVTSIWEDTGEPAPRKYVTGVKMVFNENGEDEVPILYNKKVYQGFAKKELIKWMWQMKSNKVQDLKDMGVNIWDPWEYKEGPWKNTIGPAYGHILGKLCRKFPISKLNWDHLNPNYDYDKNIKDGYIVLDQVDWLIQSLLTNPGSTRLITSLWDIMSLDEMNIEPCVWKTKWALNNERMDLIVGIRSNDMPVGNPFNVFQYYVLQKLICQVIGIPNGKLQFDIDDAHMYDRQIETALKQVTNTKDVVDIPVLKINDKIKNFYEFDVMKDVKLENYTATDEFKYDVAVTPRR